MKDSQLEKLNVKELLDLRERLDDMIASKQDREKADLKARFENMAKEAGLSLGEIVGGRGRKAGRSKSAAGVKYQHNDNPALTWSGRGRKPKWLSEATGDIERFRVR
ncbi:MAG: H-NS histone family protein [Hyphomicrobiaceae bacterium]|nr:H-NS histone family protein [Hyphomicrobiaceae bacterium]